ncbi:hypothetical protein AYR62_00565 [Secundilactobacillus paracollinoides]|uniref:lectin-like domain-containing protein n=1 Tax=Secundilactobacillus paracollinoides TaxID=240427 RepID=UPI00081A675B|nr:hypothetical protein [Secundilactobacillus paracollinoides]ANZ62736.1 hypothetical protein AYR62_00565 [Secundilactobacillus paracollinoides]
MKFSRHNQQQQTKVLNDNARFKLYKSKTKWLVSKRVLGVMVVTVAVGIGLSLGMAGTAYADTTVTDVPMDQQATPSEPATGSTDSTSDVTSQEAPVDQPAPQIDGTTTTDTPAEPNSVSTTNENDTLKGDGSETSTTPVDATRPITATDSQSSSEYFTPGESAIKNDGKTSTSKSPTTTADETDGSFTLTQDTVKNKAGNIIFNNDVDMTHDWEMSGSFKFSKDDDATADATDTNADNDSDWGVGFSGWQLGDGAGIVISGATQDQLGLGGDGNAFGIGGVGNSIAAVIDTHYNTQSQTGKAANGVNYTEVADEPVSTASGLDNDPGTLQVIGNRWINKNGHPENGVALDVTGTNGSQDTSAGGAAIRNDGLNQAVVKFVTTNADGSVVTPDVDSEKAYSPSSAVGSSTAANASGEHFVATWKPDLTTLDPTTGTVSGTLTVTWYGNDSDAYKNGFTISTKYTASTNSSIGLISSNGNQTATTVATVDSFTGNVKSQLVTIDYHVNGTDAPELQTSNVSANIGDTLAVSPDGTTASDVNLTLPKLQGYHVSQITLNGQKIAADQVIMTVSRAAADNTLLVTYEPNTIKTTVTVPTTLVQTNGDETSGTVTISDVSGSVGETVTVEHIPGTYTDGNGTVYTTTETTTQGLVNADGSITVKTPVTYTAIPAKDATLTYVDTTTGKTVATKIVSGQEEISSDVPFVTTDDGTYTADDGTVYGLADGQAMNGKITFVDGDADNVTVNLIELTTQSNGTLSVVPVIQIETNGDDSTLSKNVISNSDTGNISFTDTANKTTNTNTWQNDGNSYMVDMTLLPRDDSYDYTNATVKVMDQNGQVIETLTGVDLNDIIDSTTGELKTIFLNVPQGSQLSGAQVLGKTGVTTDDTVVMTGAENGLSDAQKTGTTVIISVPGEEIDYTVYPTHNGGKKLTDPVSEHGRVGTPITIPNIPGYEPANKDQKVTADEVSIVEYTPTEQKVTVVPVLQDVQGETVIKVDDGTDLTVKGSTDSKVDAPKISGYEPTTQVEIPAANGTTTTIVYTPTQQTVTVNPVSSDGTQMVITDGTILTVSGDTNTNVDAPVIPGYTTDQKVKIQSTDGTQTVTYTPTKQTVTIVPISSKTGEPITTDKPLQVTGTTGSTIDMSLIPYSTTETIQTPTQDGSQNVTYTPNSVTGTVEISNTDGTKITVDGVTGDTDEIVDVTVPLKKGYTSDHDTVKATVGRDGKITTDETVTYTPNTVTGSVKIPSNKGDIIVNNVTGQTDEMVSVEVPKKKGYTVDHNKVQAIINPDGTITPDETVTYTPNSVTGSVKIPSNKGDIIVDNVTGQTDQTVTVEVPEKPGYTVDHNTVNATVKPDGTITTDETVIYTPNTVTGKVKIPSNKGDIIVDNVTGQTDQTVTVEVPEKPGYTVDHNTVNATVKPDGTIKTDETVTYTPSPVTGTVTIPSNKGDVTVDGVTVEGDQSVDVKVPTLPGYTPDHDTISAHLDTKGNITTDDKVIYTPIVTNQPDNSGSGQNTGSNSGDTQNTGTTSTPKNDGQNNQPSIVTPEQSDGSDSTTVQKPTDLASISETVTPIHIASHGAHKGTT